VGSKEVSAFHENNIGYSVRAWGFVWGQAIDHLCYLCVCDVGEGTCRFWVFCIDFEGLVGRSFEEHVVDLFSFFLVRLLAREGGSVSS
jgi:hypothetical protein